MTAFLANGMKRRRPLCRMLLLLCSMLPTFCAQQTLAEELLFAPPAQETLRDQVFLISTRAIGTDCSDQRMLSDLSCEQLKQTTDGPNWKPTDWRTVLPASSKLPTLFYVHGNRVELGEDRREGLAVYQSFKAVSGFPGPVQFVIWSWPSGQIPGPIKDYLVKAQRTNPVSWQLAWLLDKFPEDARLALVGYSYGTRVVSGATHLLAGGQIETLALSPRLRPQRPPVRAGLLAAAYDADWLQPRELYSRAINQLDRLVICTNQFDPAMRFYHLSNGRGRTHALGKTGVEQPWQLGRAMQRVSRVDFTQEVGRSHVIYDYLAAPSIARMWQQLLGDQTQLVAHVETDRRE